MQNPSSSRKINANADNELGYLSENKNHVHSCKK